MTVCSDASASTVLSVALLTCRTTPDPPEPKSRMSPTLSLTVPTVSCCLERPPRVNTPSRLVRHPVHPNLPIYHCVLTTHSQGDGRDLLPRRIRSRLPIPIRPAPIAHQATYGDCRDFGHVCCCRLDRAGCRCHYRLVHQWYLGSFPIQVPTRMPHHLW